MKCKDIQDKLLLSGIGDGMKAHIENCAECSEFSKIVAGMNDVQLPGPSAQLDAKVLDFARNNRPSSKKPIPFYILTAVAALLIVAFSIMLLSNKAPQKNSVVDSGAVDKTEEVTEKTALAVDNVLEEDLNEALDSLWDDDVMTADITAIEGELFVLSAELYSN